MLLEQIHSNQVVNLENYSDAKKGDALISGDQKKLIGVLTADCVPILLYNRANRKVAAVHAGWRGAVSDIIGRAVEMISGNLPSDIYAAIGPCIRAESYEVNHDFYRIFLSHESSYKNFFYLKKNKLFFDIARFCHYKLLKCGVKKIDDLKIDTYKNPDLFFSCRRSLHENKKFFGCQASVISCRIS